ncbi:hypothetical protein DSUL_20099 [Desulfovibrionales bacterium]
MADQLIFFSWHRTLLSQERIVPGNPQSLIAEPELLGRATAEPINKDSTFFLFQRWLLRI